MFKFLGENTKTYIILSVPIKNTERSIQNKIHCWCKIYVSSSRSTLDDNLSEGIQKDKWKDCKYDLEYITASAVDKENILKKL